MKVLVTGARGQLGHDVCRTLVGRQIECCGVCSADADITDRRALLGYIKRCRPDVVIHCAAYTSVERAEEEPERCWAVNAEGTRNVSLACREIGAKMMYISTDYVFPGDGEQFYRPEDPTGPLNVYGRSKQAGERTVQELLERFFIVRTSWLFGGQGNNFVKTMLRLSQTKTEVNVVCDQIGSPTYSEDLALLLCSMIGTEQYGIYHASNEGICSWADFAEEIFRIAGKKVKVNPIPASRFPSKATRPANSRMSKDKLEKMGFSRLPSWQDALKRYLASVQVTGEEETP